MTSPACPNCSQPVSADDRFCIQCGASMPEVSSPQDQPLPPLPEGADSAAIRQEIGQLQQDLQAAGQLLEHLMDRLVAIQRAQFEQPGQPLSPEPASAPAPAPAHSMRWRFRQ